jgi:hypothetical protein
MLSILRRKPKPIAMIEQGADLPSAEPARRNRQQNIKVSEDCAIAFAALADAHGLSKAALFEDMVAERLEMLRRQGIKLATG